MKTAREAIGNGIQEVGAGTTISAYGVCPECGHAMRIEFDYQAARDFPLLDAWSRIIVCNDCGDFRTAFRDRTDQLVRRVNHYRMLCYKSLNGEFGADVDTMLGDARKLMRPLVLSLVKSLIRALAKRSKSEVVDPEGWTDRMMDVFSTRKSYGDDTPIRTVDLEDHTRGRVWYLQKHYGVETPNHWRKVPMKFKPDTDERGIPD